MGAMRSTSPNTPHSDLPQSSFQAANELLRALVTVDAIDKRRQALVRAGVAADTPHLTAEYSFVRLGQPLVTTYGNATATAEERATQITLATNLLADNAVQITEEVRVALESNDPNLASTARTLQDLCSALLDVTLVSDDDVTGATQAAG